MPLGYVTPATRSGRSISMRMAARYWRHRPCRSAPARSVRRQSRPAERLRGRGRERNRRIDDALETLARLTGQLVPARRPEHRERIPVAPSRRISVVAVPTSVVAPPMTPASEMTPESSAMTTSSGSRCARRRRASSASPRLRATDHQVAGHLGRIERVQRLAEFEHHVVGDVDGRRDRAYTGEQQSTLHPPRASPPSDRYP